MVISDRQLLDLLSRTPFVDSAELALILDEPHATVHRALTSLLAEGIAGRVSHGTAHLAVQPEILPDGQRHQTGSGVARLRDARGLRASLPCVQGVAAEPKCRCGGPRVVFGPDGLS